MKKQLSSVSRISEPGSEMYIPHVGGCASFLMFHYLVLARVLFPQRPLGCARAVRRGHLMSAAASRLRHHLLDLLQAALQIVLKISFKKLLIN